MGIQKDPKTGLWTVSVSMRPPGGGNPISMRRTGIKSEREARQLHNQLIKQVTLKSREKVIPSWQRLCEEYSENALRRGLGANTVDNMRLCLQAHTFPIWGKSLANEITTDQIRNLVTIVLSEKSESHRKQMLKFIRNVFKFGIEIGIIDRDPTPKMQFRIGNKLKTVLTEAQAKILLERAKEVNHEYYPVWAIALYTGLRSGELWALKWEKVNFTTRQLMVDSSWNSKTGFKSTKSGDDRIVEIAPALLPLLKELKLQSEDRIFVLPRIESWERGRQAEILRSFLLMTGLPRIRFHDLRASWATILLSKGIEPIKVMTVGGWKDLKTMAYYIRKAGVDIKGVTDDLVLHSHTRTVGTILDFSKVQEGSI